MVHNKSCMDAMYLMKNKHSADEKPRYYLLPVLEILGSVLEVCNLLLYLLNLCLKLKIFITCLNLHLLYTGTLYRSIFSSDKLAQAFKGAGRLLQSLKPCSL